MCHSIFLSIFTQEFYVIINRGIIAPVHVREVVDGINVTEKNIIFKLMSTVQILSEKVYVA